MCGRLIIFDLIRRTKTITNSKHQSEKEEELLALFNLPDDETLMQRTLHSALPHPLARITQAVSCVCVVRVVCRVVCGVVCVCVVYGCVLKSKASSGPGRLLIFRSHFCFLPSVGSSLVLPPFLRSFLRSLSFSFVLSFVFFLARAWVGCDVTRGWTPKR